METILITQAQQQKEGRGYSRRLYRQMAEGRLTEPLGYREAPG